ncbi:MAG TPA: hypothetical protein VHF67_08725 [Gaiellaceae bacterium]|nr:hypothetical protein [Gaiellaceae bacterium]
MAVVAVILVVIGALSTGIAIAAGGDDDRPLTGSTLENANVAALEHTGGTVIETEVGDDGAAYGVEVRRDDGSVVELSLDESFRVIGDETDDDGADDRDERGADD